ncbi:MAG: hypothetical protein J3R72DRAFT_459640 [Linnemannia gamsii]|nr:MAG: hypothetical protein J3R72DRAFT_459640 [Linnemannia gamsii]
MHSLAASEHPSIHCSVCLISFLCCGFCYSENPTYEGTPVAPSKRASRASRASRLQSLGEFGFLDFNKPEEQSQGGANQVS